MSEQTSTDSPATTAVSVTAATGVGATLTIPAAPAGLFNYLDFLEIVQVGTLTAAGVTAVVVTSTGITGTPSFSFGSDYVIGRAIRYDYQIPGGLKGSAAATAITVVCPATTNVLWRVNGFYHVGP
jgi:hypothetical protein